MTPPITMVKIPPLELITHMTPDHIATSAVSIPARRPDSVTVASSEIVTKRASACSQGTSPLAAQMLMAMP